MKHRRLDLFEHAKKVDAFSPKKGDELKNDRTRLKGIRLPSLELNFLKKAPKVSLELPIKNPMRMTIEDCDKKKVSFIRSAYAAYKCCQKQDLHLFQHRKIYLEKCFSLRGVVGWRLPKKKIVQQRLRSLVDGLKFNTDGYKSHLITWILKLKEPQEEKIMKEHIELQKERKERRAYLNSKSIF
ncbi:MAG: hypothetical protein FJZ59_02565 [Chlamydiae bacterium]|jgi:hypothetical protein|nr:hypothetical protein [Chlamydiota bacterium]